MLSQTLAFELCAHNNLDVGFPCSTTLCCRSQMSSSLVKLALFLIVVDMWLLLCNGWVLPCSLCSCSNRLCLPTIVFANPMRRISVIQSWWIFNVLPEGSKSQERTLLFGLVEISLDSLNLSITSFVLNGVAVVWWSYLCVCVCAFGALHSFLFWLLSQLVSNTAYSISTIGQWNWFNICQIIFLDRFVLTIC